MSFVDLPDLGSKITDSDHQVTGFTSENINCDSGSMSFPIIITMLVLYCYQVRLAYKLADSLSRKLKLIHAVFYIPISIFGILRLLIGACVISYLYTSILENNARAPSVETNLMSTVTVSTGSISIDNNNAILREDELREVIISNPDPNRDYNESGIDHFQNVTSG